MTSLPKRGNWGPLDPSERPAGRIVYGLDAAGYDAGRPGYPERVYEVLKQRCGLRHGSLVLEIGPGTGQATRRLLRDGARVVAVEPDPGLAAYLERTLAGQSIEVVDASFEDADLDDNSFDLVGAGTSFHWLDPGVGLPKVAGVLRPGGWAALFWTIFGDPDRPDPFDETVCGYLGRTPGEQARAFWLDEPSRRRDLADRAGLADVESERMHWTCRMDPLEVRAFYASLMVVRVLPQSDQERALDLVERVAGEQFGGVVERPFVTVLYTGRKPDDERAG